MKLRKYQLKAHFKLAVEKYLNKDVKSKELFRQTALKCRKVSEDPNLNKLSAEATELRFLSLYRIKVSVVFDNFMALIVLSIFFNLSYYYPVCRPKNVKQKKSDLDHSGKRLRYT